LDSFLTFINQQGIDFKNEPTLLAVSGGVDSVVMAHLFYTLGYPAGIAHCNFGLRGAESEADEEFVRSLSGQYDFPFYTERFEVKQMSVPNPISTQMAARTLRYKWFEDIRLNHKYQWIATAHHTNDSIETLILNLARGTGLSGLKGISPKTGNLVRPMLYVSREEILDYATSNNLVWREDSSNASDGYRRNLIRHNIMPVLKQLNPSLEKTFIPTAERLAAADNLLGEYLKSWEKDNVIRQGNQLLISIEALSKTTEVDFIIWNVLKSYGFQYSQISAISRGLSGAVGKFFLSATHMLLVDRLWLIVTDRALWDKDSVTHIQDVEKPHIFDQGILYFNDDARELSKDKETATVDATKLVFPLTIRKWEVGDAMQPLGMNGKKKNLSDLFIDAKLSRLQKEKIRLLVNGNDEIIWVIGMRLDERYKVQEGVARMLEVRFVNSNSPEKI
jgi:tRNA(Ile)-lysidine synthase